MSSTVNDCFANGGGTVGNGCVGQNPRLAFRSEGRAARRSARWVRRSPGRTRTASRVLLATATTSRLRPLWRIVVNCGAALGSMSHKSWCTSWKCQQALARARVERDDRRPEESRRHGRSIESHTSGNLAECRQYLGCVSIVSLAPGVVSPIYFHASFGHVSYPNSPGRGTVWNVQPACRRARHRRECPPGGDMYPSPVALPRMIRFSKTFRREY